MLFRQAFYTLALVVALVWAIYRAAVDMEVWNGCWKDCIPLAQGWCCRDPIACGRSAVCCAIPTRLAHATAAAKRGRRACDEHLNRGGCLTAVTGCADTDDGSLGTNPAKLCYRVYRGQPQRS